MRRHSKKMVLTMGVVIASVALVSGFGTVPGSVQAGHLGGEKLLTFRCTYESANGGDAFASMQEDLAAVTDDGVIDQGGCIVSGTGHDLCYTVLARDQGDIGDSLGDLTLDFMADGMSLPADEAQQQNASLSCNLREIDFGALPDQVRISVTVIDDYWEGQYISGVLCSESTDDDLTACETDQLSTPEEQHVLCNNQLDQVGPFDLTTTNHLVVFLDGPANVVASGCGNESINPLGATTGGLATPGYGVIFTFYEA